MGHPARCVNLPCCAAGSSQDLRVTIAKNGARILRAGPE